MTAPALSNAAREVLVRARARIDTPEKWCKGWYARGADGERRWAGQPDCVAFCSSGAIGREAVTAKDYDESMDALREAADVENFIRWQDAPERTHADVMRAFDVALGSPA